MEPLTNNASPENQGTPNAPRPVSARSRAKTYRLALVVLALLICVGILAWKVLAILFGNHESEPAVSKGTWEDPRATYQGPIQNIHPDIQYVGTKACIKCHSGLAEVYSQTPMGRSLIPMPALAEKKWYDDVHHNPLKGFNSLLRIERQGQQVWHSQIKLDEKGQAVFQNKMEVQYAIGSGNHGHSFLNVEDDYVFQTGISWFGKKQQFWDVSPGFAEFYRRPVMAKCLFCHADRALPRENYVNRYQPMAGGWHSIGCERCHGPGGRHVHNPGLADLASTARDSFKKDVTKADLTIVNPGKLRPKLAEAICQQCHLEGEKRIVRRGQDLYAYRPGLPLDLFWSIFVDGRESGEDKKAVNHVEQMYLSRCFQRSQGDDKLGCITCHDPHLQVATAQRKEHFQEKCLKCHAPGDKVEAGKKPCLVPLAKRRQENGDHCVGCHMRPYGTSDIAHAASTDHRILRRPEKEGAGHQDYQPITLEHFHRGRVDPKDKELSRDLGIALARFAMAKAADRLPQAIDLLEKALLNFPDDLEVWEEKGNALIRQQRRTEALACFEFVLAKNPEKESALAMAAWMCQNLGNRQQAREYWNKAVAMNPWMTTYQANLTTLLVQTNAWNEVGVPCLKWLHLNPGNLEARKYLVEYYLRTDNVAQAQAELARLEALLPAQAENLKAWFQDIKNRKRMK